VVVLKTAIMGGGLVMILLWVVLVDTALSLLIPL
jgi:hypothetical protein